MVSPSRIVGGNNLTEANEDNGKQFWLHSLCSLLCFLHYLLFKLVRLRNIGLLFVLKMSRLKLGLQPN